MQPVISTFLVHVDCGASHLCFAKLLQLYTRIYSFMHFATCSWSLWINQACCSWIINRRFLNFWTSERLSSAFIKLRIVNCQCYFFIASPVIAYVKFCYLSHIAYKLNIKKTEWHTGTAKSLTSWCDIQTGNFMFQCSLAKVKNNHKLK